MKLINILLEEEALNTPIVYIEEKPNSFLFPKGTVYCWLYSDPDAERKIRSREYSAVMFKPTGPMRIGGTDILNSVWNKSHLAKFEGSEFLLGIIKGWYDEEEQKLYIELMTVHPKHRRRGINSHMIRFLRSKLGLSQDQVVFDDPTPQGNKFIAGKKYEEVLKELDLDSYSKLMNKTADYPWIKFLNKGEEDKKYKSYSNINASAKELFKREFYKTYPLGTEIQGDTTYVFKGISFNSNFTNYALAFNSMDGEKTIVILYDKDRGYYVKNDQYKDRPVGDTFNPETKQLLATMLKYNA